MVRELFLNTCILMSFIFVGSQVFKNVKVNTNASLKLKFILGAGCGVLGIILMNFSIQAEPSVLMDLRYIAIILAAFLGGYAAALLSGGIVALYRVIYFGLSFSSLIAAIGVIILSIGCGLISNMKVSQIKKWVIMYLYSLVIITVVFSMILTNKNNISTILLYYFISEGFALVITSYAINYLAISNRIYRRLKEESTKDFLTGLNNVRSFDSQFNKAVENAKNKGERLGVLILDIDFFKKVNDSYGHAAGDAVLRQLGDILIKICRSFDTVSRIGGEEFSVLMPDSTKQQAFDMAEKIRRYVESTFFVLPDGIKINITVSIGAAIYPDTVEDLEEILKIADSALYKAKQTGRNKVC